MKIIKTIKYKIKQAAFEGEVYTPKNENVWLETLERERKFPIPNKKHPSINRNRARYRPSVVDKIPVNALPQAQLDEQERNQVFDEEVDRRKQLDERSWDHDRETLRRAEVVKKWINWIGNKYVQMRLSEFFRIAWKKGRAGAGPIGSLYHASQGRESALKDLSDKIGEKIPPFEPEKLNNPNFN